MNEQRFLIPIACVCAITAFLGGMYHGFASDTYKVAKAETPVPYSLVRMLSNALD
jgi:hypothetical protein